MGQRMNSFKKSRIDDLVIEPLKQIEDQRGAVLHMLRCDSPLFTEFGEIYFSVVYPGVVKAWKRHHKMTQHFTVPVGCIRLVIFDDRKNSSGRGKVEVLQLGRPDHYNLVRMPPLVWYGFQGTDKQPSLIANCTNIPHDPEEVEVIPEDDATIPYKWSDEPT